ncbi:hypothetical protein IAQ61_007038 [Plenodomus lingam]|uniref:uncharacterized protein n=1 Tax=Leptosphaeria maculans TaxID=5022 RepID=UPI003332B4A0|nr:hypothetical protein IAQ61_007038 [Plenodomus lingam]
MEHFFHPRPLQSSISARCTMFIFACRKTCQNIFTKLQQVQSYRGNGPIMLSSSPALFKSLPHDTEAPKYIAPANLLP